MNTKSKLLTLGLLALWGANASATLNNFQGFETDTGDWVAAQGITRVQSGSGTLGLTSSSGQFHAEIQNKLDGYATQWGNAGYSRYGSSDSTYHGAFYQAIDVFIDVDWSAPEQYPSLEAFWIDMTPYHADPNNYGAEHNFRIKALGGSVEVYVDGQANVLATLPTSGWYTFMMVWRKAANPADPVLTDMKVLDANQNLLASTTVLASSPGGPFASADLRGNGYVWITLWQNGFAADLLAIDNVRTGLVDPFCPIISNLQPSLVPVNTAFSLTASVAGGITLTSAEYGIDGGASTAMPAADGAFDEWNEDLQAKVLSFTEAGVHTICVTVNDAAGNSCQECILLAVYDPSAGFVTGGGWIDSPAGAFVGPDTWQNLWSQDFSADSNGWLDNDDSPGYGVITALGDGTAKVEGFQDLADGNHYGPFSRFDGYHGSWSGTWTAEIDVYLDPASLAPGEGFDYSVAASGSDGNHRRDFVFHVTMDSSTGKLLVAGSNNTNFRPREDLETIPHFEIATAGWYTLQHRFYDAGGYLAVDLNLVDSQGQILFTETRSQVSDTIPGEVGGNRYAWFAHVTIGGGILVDNHQRFGYGPTYPTGRATFGFVSKYKKGASVPSGSTEFQFKAGDLYFESNLYDWLVVSGTRAQYKGTGKINGTGNYGFMLTAIDGQVKGGDGVDKFRIKIWDKDNGDAIVYDNKRSSSDASNDATVIGGGNIVIHK